MAMSEPEQTPEERFAAARAAAAQFGGLDDTSVIDMLEALNDRLDSLDAEVGRATDKLNAVLRLFEQVNLLGRER